MESSDIQLMLANGRSSISSIIWNLGRIRGMFGLVEYGWNESVQ
jgi:hypothetical protein